MPPGRRCRCAKHSGQSAAAGREEQENRSSGASPRLLLGAWRTQWSPARGDAHAQVAHLAQYESMYREWRVKAERLESDINSLQVRGNAKINAAGGGDGEGVTIKCSCRAPGATAGAAVARHTFLVVATLRSAGWLMCRCAGARALGLQLLRRVCLRACPPSQRLVAEKDAELAHGYRLLEASAAERSRLRHSYQAAQEQAKSLQMQLNDAQLLGAVSGGGEGRWWGRVGGWVGVRAAGRGAADAAQRRAAAGRGEWKGG